MSRFRAAGIHFIVSVLIVLSMMTLMLGLWYPGAYFKLMGGGGLLFIMAGVDVSLGPLLTLIVFKTGKKSLKLDMMIIIIMQLSALAYGTYVMFQARPVFTVFTGEGFRVSAVADMDKPDLVKANNPEWRKFPLTGPIVLGSKAPDDESLKSDIVIAGVFGGGIHQFPQYWVSYDEVKDQIKAAAKPISELRKLNQDNTKSLDKLLEQRHLQDKDLSYLPISTQFTKMSVILNAENAEIIDIVDMHP